MVELNTFDKTVLPSENYEDETIYKIEPLGTIVYVDMLNFDSVCSVILFIGEESIQSWKWNQLPFGRLYLNIPVHLINDDIFISVFGEGDLNSSTELILHYNAPDVYLDGKLKIENGNCDVLV